MLTTQIQYWTLVESKRHNLASEDLGNRTLNENIRHNYVTEAETQRHNVATEDYYTNSLNETIRHNLVTEGQGAANVSISQFKADSDRMNAETNRMNAFTNQRNAAANEMNAATNRFSAVTGYSLGLDANRIAQQNADSNTRNAEVNQQNADTREKEQNVEFLQWSTSDKNVNTNIMNAETKQGELQLGYDNLNFNQERFQWQKFIDVTEEARKTTDSLMNNAVNVMNSIKHK